MIHLNTCNSAESMKRVYKNEDTKRKVMVKDYGLMMGRSLVWSSFCCVIGIILNWFKEICFNLKDSNLMLPP